MTGKDQDQPELSYLQYHIIPRSVFERGLFYTLKKKRRSNLKKTSVREMSAAVTCRSSVKAHISMKLVILDLLSLVCVC